MNTEEQGTEEQGTRETSQHIPIDQIHVAWEWNSRGGKPTIAEVTDLVANIEEIDLLQAVLVMEHPRWYPNPEGKPYFLILGFRRTFAHQVLARFDIEAKIRAPKDEAAAICINLAENIVRSDLTLAQEVNTVERLLDLGTLNQTAIAFRLTRSDTWVSQRKMLSELPDFVTRKIEAGQMRISDVRGAYTKYKAESRLNGKSSAYDFLLKALGEIANKKSRAKHVFATAPKLEVRSKDDITKVQDRIRGRYGNCAHTKLLGWVLGAVVDSELEEILDGIGMVLYGLDSGNVVNTGVTEKPKNTGISGETLNTDVSVHEGVEVNPVGPDIDFEPEDDTDDDESEGGGTPFEDEVFPNIPKNIDVCP
jgi:ParB/RepB/Spo0J family partition protein